MSIHNHSLAKQITDALGARQVALQWEDFIVKMLKKLELPEEERAKAARQYQQIAHAVARRLEINDCDVHVIVQGSMRTQTTTSTRGNTKFDLDIVVKVSGARFQAIDPHEFFETIGQALEGLSEKTGEPVAKRRCWRLPYPGERFYFDVTPAIPGSHDITGTDLRVRDPETRWSPSNPEEFADWFCDIAKLRFPFQTTDRLFKAEARRQIDPLPEEPVAIDDVLRRAVQLMKVHRDNVYYAAPDKRKEGQPISVILVTLAAQAYEWLWQQRRGLLASPLEVLLAVVEFMPRFIDRSRGKFVVSNPKLPSENFADRWNHDGELRASEFYRWHAKLTGDLAAMFEQPYRKRSEERIRGVFGQVGVDAWKSSQSKPKGLLDGLLSSAPNEPRRNPATPLPVGSRNTLA